MARIFKMTDRLTVRIDDVVVKLAPLSLDQKTEVQQAILNAKLKTDVGALTKALVLAIKYSLKELKGVEDSDGSEYQLRFDGDKVADDCLEELMNLDLHKKLIMVTTNMLSGVPQKFTDEQNQALEGVEILNPSKDLPAGKS